jgi:uncharacterized protein YndB with AHSA1/START domain
MEPSALVIERIINVPVKKIWQALTNNNDLKHWYFDIPDFMPVIGFEFQFYGEVEKRKFLHSCKITDVIPEKKLAYTMTFENIADGSYPPVETWVCFEINAVNEQQTKLKLVHRGLEHFPVGLKYYERTDFLLGWSNMFDISLNKYLEKVKD